MLLSWSQADLAKRSSVSNPTVKRLEAADGPLGGRMETGAKIIAAFERAGVVFIDPNDGGPGVRLRKAKRKAK
jgi:predicted transcriptional regulator